MAEPIAEFAGLIARIEACDRECRNVNASGSGLPYVHSALSGASAVLATLLADYLVVDAFIAVARLQPPPVVSGGAGAKDQLRVKRSASSPVAG